MDKLLAHKSQEFKLDTTIHKHALTMMKKDADPYDYYYYSYSKTAKKPKNLGQQLKLKRKKENPTKKPTV